MYFDEKYMGNSKFKEDLEIKKLVAALVLFYDQKLLIISFVQIIFLHKLHIHVHYEEVY